MLRVLSLEEDFGEPAMRLTTWKHAGNGKIQKPDVDIAKTHPGGGSNTRSGRDLIDENSALGRADPCGTTLLRVERNAAHGGAPDVSARLEEDADIYAFALEASGYRGDTKGRVEAVSPPLPEMKGVGEPGALSPGRK